LFLFKKNTLSDADIAKLKRIVSYIVSGQFMCRHLLWSI